MKKIYDNKIISFYLKKSKYKSIIEELHVNIFLIEYEKGELVASPFQREQLFQIVAEGTLKIYFIRDDGTKYSLSSGSADYFLGDTDIFRPCSNNIYAEATEKLICIAFSIDKNKKLLLSNNSFLQLVGESLSLKLENIAAFDGASSSLTERVLSYMKYKCPCGILCGIEETAFHLHCSARQLQRVMNKCEADHFVKKIGKGTYELL